MWSSRTKRGATAVELGKRFSVSRQTILKTLERQGVGRHYNLLDDDQAEILREHYEAGASLKQLGEECGVDAGIVPPAPRCGER